jgi:xanthine dehydrogenase YagS FAD-binding subunit
MLTRGREDAVKSFAYVNAANEKEAVAALSPERDRVLPLAGGQDLLGLMKDYIAQPERVVNVKNLDRRIQKTSDGGLRIGAAVTIAELAANADAARLYPALVQAAEEVGSPQIRNVGTVGGNLNQRPRCWYYRNEEFNCLKKGGSRCFAVEGENQFHAIFGGGPSYIVHPSDAAPALIALEATFRIAGPGGERVVPAAEFFALPAANPAAENVLAGGEILTAFHLPRPRPGTRSSYHKVLDREAWTHAVVSAAVVLQMDNDVCRDARIVLGGVAPIPWRLPKVEAMLSGQRITAELAARAGEAAVDGARPLSKNAYKVPLTQAVVKRTLLDLVQSA